MQSPFEQPDLHRIADAYTVGEKIGSGSFGQIYVATRDTTGERRAVKIEPATGRRAMIMHEARVLADLQGVAGFATLHFHGREGQYNVMVMDLLGPSLEVLFEAWGQRLSLPTVVRIGEQGLYRLEQLHAKNYVHRDIKPGNFMLGAGDNEQAYSQVYLIDFGLARMYRDATTGRHVAFREGCGFEGTRRYASIGAHLGREQSRRDDLEALGYTLVHLIRGRLPWQGIKAETREEKAAKILACKQSTPIAQLCQGLPSAFTTFMYYCRALRFEGQPDYAYLRRLLRDVRTRQDAVGDEADDFRLPRTPADASARTQTSSCAVVGITAPSTSGPSRSGSCMGVRRTTPTPIREAGAAEPPKAEGPKGVAPPVARSRGIVSTVASLFACGSPKNVRM